MTRGNASVLDDHVIEPSKDLKPFLGPAAPGVLYARGNRGILEASDTLGFFCSVRCPGSLILRTYDLARRLRDEQRTVISGFHSPMERECLALLLRGTQPVVVCLARSIAGSRLPTEWTGPLAEGRLLIVSEFATATRTTVPRAVKRNLLVAALADEVFITHAERGSKTAAFAEQITSWGKPILTVQDKKNDLLLALGAKPVEVES